MHASAISANALMARATSGQRLDIRYDPRTNSIVFLEDDWSADVRGGAVPRSVFHQQIRKPKVRRLGRRAA